MVSHLDGKVAADVDLMAAVSLCEAAPIDLLSGAIAVESVVFETVDSDPEAAIGLAKADMNPDTMATADSEDSGGGHPGALVTVDSGVVAAADLYWTVTVHPFVLKGADMRKVVGLQRMTSVGVGDWDTVPVRGQVPWGAWPSATRVGKLLIPAIGGVGCFGGYYAVLGDDARASPDEGGYDHTSSGASAGQDQHYSGNSTPTAGERPRVRVSSRAGGDGSNPYSRNFDRGSWSSADRFQRTARCDELKKNLRSHPYRSCV